MILLALILINSVAQYFEARHDVAKQMRGEYVKHGQSAIFRVLAWLFVSILFNWSNEFIWYGLIKSALLFSVLMFHYFLGFDYTHNAFSGKKWYYTNKGPIDSILSGYSKRYHRLALKIFLFLASLTAYLLV
jgi:hypothetical protein